MSHGLDPMPPRRAIIDSRPDPETSKYRIYELECGHEVRRRNWSAKRYACCGECSPDIKPAARSWRAPLALP